jgi:hypothetical protein
VNELRLGHAARTMLPQGGWLCLLVWCKACSRQAPADLQAIFGRRPTIVTGQRGRACRTEG